MIRLAHVRDRQGADAWLRRRRRQLDANPVPLLVIGISETHEALRDVATKAGLDGPAFYIDASTEHEHTTEFESGVLVLADREALFDARRFIERAHKARQRLDMLLVEDEATPDLAWCEPFVDHDGKRLD